MRKSYVLQLICVYFLLICWSSLYAQESRIDQLELKLESVLVDIPGLNGNHRHQCQQCFFARVPAGHCQCK